MKNLNSRGTIARKMGDHAEAMKLFSEAKAFYDARPELMTYVRSIVLGNHGRSRQGPILRGAEEIEIFIRFQVHLRFLAKRFALHAPPSVVGQQPISFFGVLGVIEANLCN